MKTVYLTLLILFLIPMINAEIESLGNVKQDDCITLKQSCSNCSYINISAITYPNKTAINNEWAMTNDGIMFNYTFCNTNDLGQYIIDGHGDVDGIDTPFGYDFYVTTTGDKVSLSNIIIVIVFLLFALICLILGWTFNKDYWLVKSFFYVGAILMGILAINSGKIIASESLGLSSMGNTGLTIGIVIFVFVILYLFIHWTIEQIKTLREKQGVRWKY